MQDFFAYQTQKLVKELNNLKSDEKIVSEVTPEPTTDPTANWKTYTNTQYNFYLNILLILKTKVEFLDHTQERISQLDRLLTQKPWLKVPICHLMDMPYIISDIKALNFETYIQNEKSAMDNAEYLCND